MREIVDGELGSVLLKDMTVADLYTLLGSFSVIIAVLIVGIWLAISLGNSIGEDLRKFVKYLFEKYRKNDSLSAEKEQKLNI